MTDRSGRVRLLVIWLVLGLVAALSAAYGQYPGRIDTAKRSVQTARAVAVLEWTGQPGKPSASRMIPISVFDGETFQPGGLYLARPEPLALDPGTEYVLEQAGAPRGLFDVNSGQDVQGYWFGYGVWRQMPSPPPPHRSQRAKIMPQVVTEANDDSRPHFKNRSGASQQGSGGSSQGGTPQPKANEPSSAPSSSSSNSTPVDPDRPVLRRRTASSDDNSSSYTPAGPETAIGGADPDRPHLEYGSANPTGKDFEPSKLAGVPTGLEQMVAVSDASDREPHSFVYPWSDPGDAAKLQAQMETLAKKALAPPAPATKTAHKASAAPHAHPSATHHTRKAASVESALPDLTNERFQAYELTYSGGATVIFSAEATDPPGKVRYVTLIAQPDFYGVPQVIFKSVTGDDHLDETPRMRLVDAVDARGNGRGDLVFELRSRRDRQFVLYRIVEGHAEQFFTTGSLPIAATPGS